MDKKPKINLAVIKKMFDKFPETRAFIDKAYCEKCCKETFMLTRYFLTLVIIVNFSLCYGLFLYGLLWNALCSLNCFICSRYFSLKEIEKEI